MQMENARSPQQLDTIFSVEKVDENFIGTEVEGSLFSVHAEHNVAPQETNNEQYTLQNEKNEISNVWISKESVRTISAAVNEQKYKRLGETNGGAKKPAFKKK